MNEHIRNLHYSCVALLASLMVGVLPAAHAFDFNWTSGSGPWIDGGNWDQFGFIPLLGDEGVGVIGSMAAGATSTGGAATISTAAPDSAGVVLGKDTDTSGTLRVLSGGSINFLESTGEPTGAANIGLDGVGMLEVQGGGALSTTSLDVNAGSTVTIGGGAGVASVVSTDTMYLNGVTITRGPGHTFTAAALIEFEAQSQYVVDLQASTHTTLTSLGPINNVQGLLSIQTSEGFTPTSGDSWELLDGNSIDGPGFVVDSSLSALAPGHAYRTRTSSGGNGTVLELVYTALPTLKVNTNTGAVSMLSESGTPIDIIGYSILSETGSINPNNWTSLFDNSVSGWEETGVPSAQSLDELNAQGTHSLTATAHNLGNVFLSPQAFGDAPSDIVFEYAVEGESGPAIGIVKFTGTAAANNLLLTVDPTTGEAQIQNSSQFTVDLLGYSILSNSGSLDGNNWTSLESQAVSGWEEAAPDSNDEFALSELVPSGVATLAPGEAHTLGHMFSVGGLRDLALEFVLAANGTQEILDGVVQYGPIVEVIGLPGDYNNDGVVDAIDYAVWRENLGTNLTLPNEGDGVSPGVVDQDDYNFWRSQYGASLGTMAAGRTANVASVPEASCLAQLAMALLSAAGWRRKQAGLATRRK